jgi:hypothetical protein
MATAAIGRTAYTFQRNENNDSVCVTETRGQRVKVIFLDALKQVQAFVGANQTPVLHLSRVFERIQSPLEFEELLGKNRLKLEEDSSLELEPVNVKELAGEIMQTIQAGSIEFEKQPIKGERILFVGHTRVGKSLLANALCGRPIVGFRQDGIFRFGVQDPLMEVSHTSESCTTVPGVCSPEEESYSYIDCAGFEDTVGDGGVQDIANAFFRAESTRGASKLKIVLVVDHGALQKDQGHMKSTLNGVMQFLGRCSRPGGIELVADSVSLVFSKVNASDTTELEAKILRKENRLAKLSGETLVDAEEVEDLIQSIAGLKAELKDGDAKEIVERALLSCINGRSLSTEGKEFLKKIYLKKRWAIFSAPKKEGPSPLAEREIREIHRLIHEESHYLSLEDANIQVEVSTEHKSTVQNAFLQTIDKLKNELTPRLMTALEDSVKNLLKKASKEKLQTFRNRLTQFSQGGNWSLKELEAEIKTKLKIDLDAELLGEMEQIDKTLSFYATLLHSPRPAFSLKRNWVEELNVKGSLVAWTEQLDRISADPATKFENGVLKITGYFITTAQVKTAMQGLSGIQKVRLFSPLSLTFDKDLKGNSWEGIDLVPMVPRIKVLAKTEVHLKGSDGADRSGAAASGARAGDKGSNGVPGGDGGHGGHFFALCNEIDPADQLSIISDGGKEGNGQNGGGGVAGKAGDWARIPKDYHDADERGGRGDHGNGTYDQDIITHGHNGSVGSDGGRGGAKGRGGTPGSTELICLSNPAAPFKKQANPGATGTDGAGGAGGAGGVHGQHCKGIWHTGGNPDEGWNGWFPPKHQGSRGSAAAGTTPTDKNDGGRGAVAARPAIDVPAEILAYKTYLQNEKGRNPLMADLIDRFCSEIDGSDEVKKKASTVAFIEECLQIEETFGTMDNRFANVSLYQSVLGRVLEFIDANELASGETLQLNQIVGYLLSNIGRLRAAAEPRLIVDINRFLTLVQGGLAKLKELNRTSLIRHYQTQYLDEIQGQIAEADKFIEALLEDIRVSGREIEGEIKGLLEEIEEVQRKSKIAIGNMEEQKRKIIELKKKRVLLGGLQMIVGAVGCCFPGLGGPIIAGAVCAGIGSAVNGKFEGTEIGIAAEAYVAVREMPLMEELKGDLVNDPSYRLSRVVASTRAIIEIAQRCNDANNSDDEKIAELDRLIGAQGEQIENLESFKALASKDLKDSLQNFASRAEKMQSQLKEDSAFARDFKRLDVKRVFQTITTQIRDSVDESFKAQSGLLNIFEQIGDAIVSSMNIYDRIQEYQDRGRMARYIGDGALAGSETNPKIEKIQLSMQKNIILEQYSRGSAAVRQWAFPFSSFFLGDAQSLVQFERVAGIDDLVRIAGERLERLYLKVKQYHTETQPGIDSVLMKRPFTLRSPFYKWSECEEELRSLFQGERILLHADVRNSSPHRSAVKFNEIRLKIRSTDPAVQVMWEKEEEDLLIRLVHSGRSFYQYGGQIHEMFSGGPVDLRHDALPKNKTANINFEKIKNGDFALSPYTNWTVELISDKGISLFEKYANDLNSFEMLLIGNGTYVKETYAFRGVN